MGRSRRFISIYLQALGRTKDVDRPLRFELLGDDVAGLIRYFGTGTADVLGYSLGGASHCARPSNIPDSAIPKPNLVTLPRTTHYEICDSPLLPLVVLRFLDA